MDQLLETIKIINGKPQFLEFHQARLNYARKTLFNTQEVINLEQVIHNPPKEGIYRCRIIYSRNIEQLEYLPHPERNFRTFQLVEHNSIVYNFKFLNRDTLNRLVERKGQADEILIIKNGLITDTSIANVAFLDKDDHWITPATPLLKGTTRERLLSENRIVEAEIKLADLPKFTQMAMLNAMVGFYLIEDFKLI